VTSGLDPDAIEAEMSDGVLTLHLPKPAQPEPRRVEIRPGAAAVNGSGSEHASDGDPPAPQTADEPPQSEGSPSGPGS